MTVTFTRNEIEILTRDEIESLARELEELSDMEEEEGSSSSSSSIHDDKWKNSSIIIGRAECFTTNKYTHIEDTNPYKIVDHLTNFAWGRNSDNIKITVNGIVVNMRDGDLTNLKNDILQTIKNEKHFITKGEFEI